MMEEKQFSEQSNQNMNSLNGMEQDNQNLVNNTNQGVLENLSMDGNSNVPTQNAFLYTNSPTVPVSDMSVEQPIPLEGTVQNGAIFPQGPSSVVMPEVQVAEVAPVNQVTNPSGSQVQQAVPEEEKVVENRHVDVNNDVMDSDLKNTLKFMLIFAIVMLVVIILLPFISGYN